MDQVISEGDLDATLRGIGELDSATYMHPRRVTVYSGDDWHPVEAVQIEEGGPIRF